MGNIPKLIRHLSLRRGDTSELRVLEGIKLLAKELEDVDSSVKKYDIIDFWLTERGSREDLAGVDAYVRVQTRNYDSELIGIQVKSSNRSVKRHESMHPDIPCIVVSPLDTPEGLAEKIDLILIKKLGV